MKIEYIAEDGTRFPTEYACKKYERKMRYEAANKTLVGLTFDGTPVWFKETNFCKDVAFIYLPTPEMVDTFILRCEDEGMDYQGIADPGYYYWSVDYYEWKSDMQAITEEYITKANYLTDIINKIKELMG